MVPRIGHFTADLLFVLFLYSICKTGLIKGCFVENDMLMFLVHRHVIKREIYISYWIPEYSLYAALL